MFNKQIVVKGGTGLRKSKLFEDLPMKKWYHDSNVLRTNIASNYDFSNVKRIAKMNSNFSAKAMEIEREYKKSDEIAFSITKETFKRALIHHCVYDIIDKNEHKVTIIFLPISTSDKDILCGIQNFNKNFVYSNTIKNKKFYTSRILFQKTMT